MKMKYNLGGFEMKFGAGENFDGGMKIDSLEIEQEFSAKELIEIGVPALKEIAELLINTQKELTSQHNENARKEIQLQEKKFEEEVRRNRRHFSSRKESQ